MQKLRIFVSHASEDKADFARPLAEALKPYYDVWLDENELTVGDSLLQKINAGLSSSDYGVVILSPAFFKKKWPKAELDGLFALETTTRKIILPVWKDITESEVAQFSPILAGRLASPASEGVEKVTSDIRRAIETATRTREVSATNAVIQKAKLLDQSLQERANARRLSSCEEGVAIVRKGLQNLEFIIEDSIKEIQKTSKELHLGVQRESHPLGFSIIVSSNVGIRLDIYVSGLGPNWTDQTEIVCTIYKRNVGFPQSNRKPEKIREMRFKPTFNLSNQALWIDHLRQEARSTEDFVAYLLDVLLTEIEKRTP